MRRDETTAGYIVSDVERLRRPIERIGQFLYEHR
jgi:hypothetical protein